MRRPLVSVALISYNQADMIGDALQGVLVQQHGNFDIEIMAGDDCSTDATPRILDEYRDRHPDIITICPRPNNLGMHRNWAHTIEACRGEYIAILEGDDHWADPLKLQKQIDLLEKSPTAAACFSNAKVLKDDGTFSAYNYVGRHGHDLSAIEFFKLNSNPVPTCSVVFRRNMFRGFPQAYYSSPFADWILHTLLIQQGGYLYLGEVTSVYRQHGAGVWSGTGAEKQLLNKLKALRIIRSIIRPEFRNANRHAIGQQLDELLYHYRDTDEMLKFASTWLQLKFS